MVRIGPVVAEQVRRLVRNGCVVAEGNLVLIRNEYVFTKGIVRNCHTGPSHRGAVALPTATPA